MISKIGLCFLDTRLVDILLWVGSVTFLIGTFEAFFRHSLKVFVVEVENV